MWTEQQKKRKNWKTFRSSFVTWRKLTSRLSNWHEKYSKRSDHWQKRPHRDGNTDIHAVMLVSETRLCYFTNRGAPWEGERWHRRQGQVEKVTADRACSRELWVELQLNLEQLQLPPEVAVWNSIAASHVLSKVQKYDKKYIIVKDFLWETTEGYIWKEGLQNFAPDVFLHECAQPVIGGCCGDVSLCHSYNKLQVTSLIIVCSIYWWNE